MQNKLKKKGRKMPADFYSNKSYLIPPNLTVPSKAKRTKPTQNQQK